MWSSGRLAMGKKNIRIMRLNPKRVGIQKVNQTKRFQFDDVECVFQLFGRRRKNAMVEGTSRQGLALRVKCPGRMRLARVLQRRDGFGRRCGMVSTWATTRCSGSWMCSKMGLLLDVMAARRSPPLRPRI